MILQKEKGRDVKIFLPQISRNLVRRCVEPSQPPSFEVRVRRPGLGVVANIEVFVMGRAIQDSPQPLISQNQVFDFYLYIVSKILNSPGYYQGGPNLWP